MKTMEINGEIFEVTTPRNIVHAVSGWFTDETSIFNWYDRPSIYKVEIWKSWVKWAREVDGVKVFEIASANGFQFTIQGLYVADNGDMYNIYITKAHNRLIKVTN